MCRVRQVAKLVKKKKKKIAISMELTSYEQKHLCQCLCEGTRKSFLMNCQPSNDANMFHLNRR